jgi:hypothetical protein
VSSVIREEELLGGSINGGVARKYLASVKGALGDSREGSLFVKPSLTILTKGSSRGASERMEGQIEGP